VTLLNTGMVPVTIKTRNSPASSRRKHILSIKHPDRTRW